MITFKKMRSIAEDDNILSIEKYGIIGECYYNKHPKLTEAFMEQIARIYYDTYEFAPVPIDLQAATDTVQLYKTHNQPIIVLYKDSKAVSFLLGAVDGLSFCKRKHILQVFYGSYLTGIQAVRGLQFAHEILEIYARKLGLELLISNCSHMDDTLQLVRILKMIGWSSKNYMAYKEIL